MNHEINLIRFDEEYLALSFIWLSDPELAELVQSGPINRENQRKWYNSLCKRNDYHVFGVSFNGCPVGVVGLKNVDIGERSAEYFGYIGSHEHRNKGIGTAMMHLIETYAINLGIEKLYLHVTQNNIAAISLYTKMGYSFMENRNTTNIATVTLHKRI